MNIDIMAIIQIGVTIFVAFITAYLTNLNDQKKQTKEFFKQKGIEIQKEILDFWCSILFYDFEITKSKYQIKNEDRLRNENNLQENDQIEDVMIIKLVQKDSFMYSSKKTNKYIAKYMQEIYKSTENVMVQMYLVTKIICCMKYDFTGEKNSVMDLLQIKINDLNIKKKFQIYCYAVKYFCEINILFFI